MDTIDDFLSVEAEAKAEPKEQQPVELEPKYDRWFDFIRPESVNVILGRKGFGKSALAYWLCDETSKRHNLLPVVINLPEEKQNLLPGNYVIRTLDDIPNLSDAVILIDEGTTMLPAGQKKLEEMVKGYVALSRQRNQLILFIFHASSDVGSRILRGMDNILLKVPSQRQIQHGSKDNWWRGLLTEAKERFKALADMGANQKEYTYVDSEEPEFRGMLQNPLPSYWKEELSKAWAGVNNLAIIDPSQTTMPITTEEGIEEIQEPPSVVAERLIEGLTEDQLRYALGLVTEVTDAAMTRMREYAHYPKYKLQEMLAERGLSTQGLHIHLAARLAAYQQEKGGIEMGKHKIINQSSEEEIELAIIHFSQVHNFTISPEKNLDNYVKRVKSTGHCACHDDRFYCPCDEAYDEVIKNGHCGCWLFVNSECLKMIQERIRRKIAENPKYRPGK